MTRDTKLKLQSDDRKTRAVVRKAAARELLPALGKRWADAKAEELKAKAARLKVQNQIVERLGLACDEQTHGVAPGSVHLTGLEVYREPQKIDSLFFVLCHKLGLDVNEIAPEGPRRVDLAQWEKLTEEQRTALAVGLNFSGTGFRVRVPEELYATAKTLDKNADEEI